MAIDKKLDEQFRKYISTRKVLIADENKGTRASLFKLVVDIGAKTSSVITATSFAEAEEFISGKKPDVVLAEYTIGGGRGLELLQLQRRAHPDLKNSLFVMVTSNSSQAAVAKAAEEEVDAFVLKPFTPEVLKSTILQAANIKISPPPYLVEVESGKALLASGDLGGAEAAFQKAVTLDPKPALALSYLADVYVKKTMVQEARRAFEKGLSYNPIHYRSILGLYDLLLQLKIGDQAYELCKKMIEYLPLSLKRLTEALKLAITTKQFEDVLKYYSIYTALETKDETFVNHVSVSFVICGKHFFQVDNPAKGLEYLQKAALASTGSAKIIREIVQILIGQKMGSEAEKFLVKYPQDQRQSAEFQLLDFEVANFVAPDTVLKLGRDLLNKGVVNIRIYEVMTQCAIRKGADKMVRGLIDEASGKYPDQVDRIQKWIG